MNKMKTIIKIILVFLPVMSMFASTQDTIYVMRSGMVLYKKVITDVDSISFENTLINRKSIIDKIAADKSYSIFYRGLVATGLADSLRVDRDKKYDFNQYSSLVKTPKESGSWYYEAVPNLRRYGFTVLMESDTIFNGNGVTDLASLKAYAANVYNQVYPSDANITDVTNRKNSLNRFIAYHIINKKLKLNMFIDAYDTDHMLKSVDMYEYLEPLCPNSLIEIKKDRLTNKTNLINYSTKTGTAIQIIPKTDTDNTYNGLFFGIDNILSFNPNVVESLSSRRLRFNIAGFFPELTNNGMRGLGETNTDLQDIQYIIPKGYLSGLVKNDQTSVSYLTPYFRFEDYEGDELDLTPSSGNLYYFTVTTPPILAGTYEVRFGYITNGKRGVAEFYIDGISAGAPVDLNFSGITPQIGYVTPGTDPADPFGFENDKMMRNHGYMKAPACFKVPSPGWYSGENARYSNVGLRKILGTYTFSEAGHHTLTVKGLSNGVFMYNYLEFVPVSALEAEDIY